MESGATKIIHVDMDAFYASVEQRDFPEYRGRPIAVGGAAGRGVVATASYEARAFGVRSAMPGARARELCPDLIFVPSRMGVYQQVSREIHGIFRRFSSRVEPLALDEAYLDVTQMPEGYRYASQVGKAIQSAIREERVIRLRWGFTLGLWRNRIGLQETGGITVVVPGVSWGSCVMPVRKLWGVGPAMEERLHRLGLRYIQDLRSRSRLEMERALGSMGHFLRELAFGRDSRRVSGKRASKSRGAERTFQSDILELETLHEELGGLAERLARTLSRSTSGSDGYPQDTIDNFDTLRAHGLRLSDLGARRVGAIVGPWSDGSRNETCPAHRTELHHGRRGAW